MLTSSSTTRTRIGLPSGRISSTEGILPESAVGNL